MKSIIVKKGKKGDRELKVLKGLIELYLDIGKPVGSNTLKETLFPNISSATIRNYFVSLEEANLLSQQHTSGGRAPTAKAFQWYAHQVKGESRSKKEEEALDPLLTETKEITGYLQNAVERLSKVTGYATFMVSPRFDHDFVLEIKLLPLDSNRLLCALVTDFGSVLTEILQVPKKISLGSAKKLEEYFIWRLGGEKAEGLSDDQQLLGQKLYNELMVRYITRYSSFTAQEIIQGGFSRLLAYPEFHHATALANGLALFENGTKIRKILDDTVRKGDLTTWIADELKPYTANASHCAVVAIPYSIQGVPVGAVGILGPIRMDYGKVFGLIERFSQNVSVSLAKSLYRFKIQYRQPEVGELRLEQEERLLLSQMPQLIEGQKE